MRDPKSAPVRSLRVRERVLYLFTVNCTLSTVHFLLRYLGTVAAVILTVNLVPGITVEGGLLTIFLVAVVWSVFMMIIKPILTILTLPITLLTLGLFSFVINAFLFYALGWLVPGFSVDGFVPALLGAVVLSLFTWLIHKLL